MSFHSVPALLFITTALALTGCNKASTNDSNASGELIVRIGSAAPLTGNQAHAWPSTMRMRKASP
jgi:hypothetical protein